MPEPDITDVTDLLPRKPSAFVRRPLVGVKLIVVHYDAQDVVGGEDSVERYAAQARYHIEKNWNMGPDGQPRQPAIRGFGLMYHYKVNPVGRIYRTQPEWLLTWHARAANPISLAICLDLGPDQSPTSRQQGGLRRLLDWLCFERPDLPAGRSDVFGHGELVAYGNSTACPGRVLPWVQNYRSESGTEPLAGARFFPQTGQAIQGAFRAYFEAHGDIAALGLPLTAEMIMMLEDGEVHTVQWFERARLEVHGGMIMPGRVGAEALAYLHGGSLSAAV